MEVKKKWNYCRSLNMVHIPGGQGVCQCQLLAKEKKLLRLGKLGVILTRYGGKEKIRERESQLIPKEMAFNTGKIFTCKTWGDFAAICRKPL